MCMADYSEPATMAEHVWRTARKPHLCGDCGRRIEPGERYHYLTWLYEGQWSHGKACAHCEEAARWLGVVCSGWMYSAIIEDLAEHLDEYPRGCAPRSSHLVRLVRYARGRWRRRDGSLVQLDDVVAWTTAALDRVPAAMRGAA